MKRRIAIPALAAAALALAPVYTQQRGVTAQTLRGYLERMGMRSVPHPKSADTIVVPRSENQRADRIDLYIEIRPDQTLALTAYPKFKGRYFSVARAVDREKMFQRLLEANHRAFSTFFVDNQGDIGVRFTFTTENGVAFESFRVAVMEVFRIADDYTPTLDEYMRKDEQK